VIPNPVDVDFFSPLPSPKPPGDDWRLVSSGRLVGWKGFSNLLDAMAKLRGEIPLRFTLAGDGPEREPLQKKIDALGLNAKLCGLLDRDALRDLLHSGDLYVLPSIGLEAFSISALEAGCVGLPLALSDRVGLASYLTPKDVATYPAQSADDLARLLRELYAKRNDSAWTDHAARHARLQERFSPENVARQILSLI
jgi:glycosyltransferase involved in cell wall biosynthesis